MLHPTLTKSTGVFYGPRCVSTELRKTSGETGMAGVRWCLLQHNTLALWQWGRCCRLVSVTSLILLIVRVRCTLPPSAASYLPPSLLLSFHPSLPLHSSSPASCSQLSTSCSSYFLFFHQICIFSFCLSPPLIQCPFFSRLCIPAVRINPTVEVRLACVLARD